MAYQGKLSPDGKEIAYSPLPPAYGFDYMSYVSWGNYHGGRASTIWITSLPGLNSVEIPHEAASDFNPVYVGGMIYFLSGRKGHSTIFVYDPDSKKAAEVIGNDGPDIRSLAGEGDTLVYDRLGEIYLFDTKAGTSKLVPIEIDADMPEVRQRIASVGEELEHVHASPTGLRAVAEAHGDIFTVAVKHGPTRDITNTPGVMEREPAWSPDGQSIAYFSDESGLYALHVSSQTGNAVAGAAAIKKFPLETQPAYYFGPKWSPDSKKIAFYDNQFKTYVLDTTTGKLAIANDKNMFGGFSNEEPDFAWSPDSKWIAYARSMPNHLHAIFLYSLESGQSTQATSTMGESHHPAFDRDGKYLYFLASTNAGATSDGLDMTSDLYQVTSNIYAVALAADTASPIAPEMDDEKAPGTEKPDEKAEKKSDGDQKATDAKEGAGDEKAHTKTAPKPSGKVDLIDETSRSGS